MTYLADRLSELHRHLDHLAQLRPRVSGASGARALRDDLSLSNDVAYSMLIVIQRTIDVAAELSSRRGLRFEDYQEVIRNLAIHEELSDSLIRRLEPLPELRNALLYGPLEPERAAGFVGRELDGVERFVQAVARIARKRA